MATLRADAPATELNRLRAEVLDHALARAALPPGLFHAHRADRRRQDAGFVVVRA